MHQWFPFLPVDVLCKGLVILVASDANGIQGAYSVNDLQRGACQVLALSLPAAF